VIDCFGGLEDLDQGILRHVSPAFTEDPVRVLRAARFAARLGRWGFRVAHGTHGLMKRMTASEDFRALRPERVWRETLSALGEEQPWRYFEVLHRCGALEVAMPDLARRLGEPEAHRGRGDAPPMAALRRAAALTEDRAVRFAAIMHDAAVSDPRALCKALRAEADCCELLEAVVRQGPGLRAAAQGDAAGALALLEGLRALQRPERFRRVLLAVRALWPEPGGQSARRLEAARQAAAGVTARSLAGSGLSGPALGEALSRRRVEAIERAWESAPGSNTPPAAGPAPANGC
jgi:tRNA nucleotidyltransferase (CCA-adding enzyme)